MGVMARLPGSCLTREMPNRPIFTKHCTVGQYRRTCQREESRPERSTLSQDTSRLVATTPANLARHDLSMKRGWGTGAAQRRRRERDAASKGSTSMPRWGHLTSTATHCVPWGRDWGPPPGRCLSPNWFHQSGGLLLPTESTPSSRCFRQHPQFKSLSQDVP